MKIRIKEAKHGSPDGIRTKLYTKGEVYDVPSNWMSASLSEVFLTNGWATTVAERKPKAADQVPSAEASQSTYDTDT